MSHAIDPIGVVHAQRGSPPPADSFEAHATLRRGIVRVEARLESFCFPLHSHDHLCLGLMRRGEYTSRYGLRRYRPRGGDVIFVNPGDVHDGRPSGGVGRAYTMLEIEPAAYERICLDSVGRSWVDFPQSVVRSAPVRAALAAWLKALAGASAEVEREAAAILIGSLSLAESRAQSHPRSSVDLAARVKRLLMEQDGPADSIGELAGKVGASRFRLIRAFKTAFGETPEGFRRQLRVQRARSLLPGSEALASIAARAGFADQSHMTREFRRVTGLTPGAYRRVLG
jgi:AraC-like DNA-binding protein